MATPAWLTLFHIVFRFLSNTSHKFDFFRCTTNIFHSLMYDNIYLNVFNFRNGFFGSDKELIKRLDGISTVVVSIPPSLLLLKCCNFYCLNETPWIDTNAYLNPFRLKQMIHDGEYTRGLQSSKHL